MKIRIILFVAALLMSTACASTAEFNQDFTYIPGGPIEYELDKLARKYIERDLLVACDDYFHRDIQEKDRYWLLHSSCIQFDHTLYTSNVLVAPEFNYVLMIDKESGDVRFYDRIGPLL